MTKCVRHPKHDAVTTCRICKSECCGECSSKTLGICHSCGYKIVIVIFIIMIAISYVAWFGVL